MKETITSRVSRIISGSAKKLVEVLESAAPETVMEEAISEIDNAIYDLRSELGKLNAQKHLATKRLMEANKKHEDLSAKIEFAVDQSRDDLAEAAIAQQMDIEAQIPVLENSIMEAKDKGVELEGYITALQAKKREMRDELREFRKARAEAKSESVTDSGTGHASIDQKVERAEAAFDRMVEKTTGLEASSRSDMQNAAKLEELEDLTRQNRIRERLAAIKAKSGDK